MQYLTAVEAARRLGVSEKTVRNWIAHAKLSAYSRSKNRLAIPLPEVEKLARERQQYLNGAPDTHQQFASLAASLAETIARVDTLEETIAHIGQGEDTRQALPAASREPRAKRKPDLPAGCLSMRDFAEQNGVAVNTMRDHVVTGLGKGGKERLLVEEKPKPGRPNETERYLTPDQQDAARAFWDRHGIPWRYPAEPGQAEAGRQRQRQRQRQAEDAGAVDDWIAHLDPEESARELLEILANNAAEDAGQE